MLFDCSCNHSDLHGSSLWSYSYFNNCSTNLSRSYSIKKEGGNYSAPSAFPTSSLVCLWPCLLLAVTQTFLKSRPFLTTWLVARIITFNYWHSSYLVWIHHRKLDQISKVTAFRVSLASLILSTFCGMSFFCHQPEKRVCKIPIETSSLVNLSASLRSSLLFCADLQHIQRFLLGRLSYSLCTSKFSFGFNSRSTFRQNTT